MKILRNRGSSEKAKKAVAYRIAGAGGVAAYDLVKVTTAGAVLPASADSEVNATVYGMAESAIAASAMGELTTNGRIYNPSWFWTIGGTNNNLLWLHMTTAKLTETIPATVGKFCAPVAQVIGSDTIILNPEAFSVTEIL